VNQVADAFGLVVGEEQRVAAQATGQRRQLAGAAVAEDDARRGGEFKSSQLSPSLTD